MITSFYLAIWLLTTLTNATLFNSASFTISNTGAKNGATLSIENENDVTVNTPSNNWDVVITDQKGWQFRLDLDSTWGFHPTTVSTIIFTMDGTAPGPDTDQDWIISLSVGGTEYFSTWISLDGGYNYIIPNCSVNNSPIPSLLSGDVYTAVNDINSTMVLDWNRRVIQSGWPVKSMIGFEITPWLMPNEYPLIYQLENDPINDVFKITITNPTWESQDFRQICYYKAFTTNAGLNIFIAGDDIGEKYAVSLFDIKYYYDTDNPSISPTRFPTRIPSVSPTRFPTNYPTTFPSKNPTISPSKYPSSSPTYQPSLQPSQNPSQRTTAPSMMPSTSPSKGPTAPEGQIPMDDLVTTIESTNMDDKQDLEADMTSVIPRYVLYLLGVVVILCLLIIICLGVLKIWLGRKEVSIMQDTGPVNTGTKEMIRIKSGSSIHDSGEHIVGTDAQMNMYKQDTLAQWLTNIKLMHLYGIFAKQKFNVNFDKMYQLREEDLKKLGVNVMSERKLIMNQLTLDQMNVTKGSPQSDSITHESTNEYVVKVSGEQKNSFDDGSDSDSRLFNKHVNITPVIKVTPSELSGIEHTKGNTFMLDNAGKQIQEVMYQTAM